MDKLKAIIFDMDGTLVDNIVFHKNSWLIFLMKHHISLDPVQFQAQNHGNIDEMIKKFFGPDLTTERLIELGQEKEKIYMDLYRNHIQEVDGLTDLLIEMNKKGILAGLATNSDLICSNFILEGLKVKSYFSAIARGDEVLKGKPDPEVFELILNKMNLKNYECLAIEDSLGGVHSALKAGIKVIGISTSHTKEELIENGCFYSI